MKAVHSMHDGTPGENGEFKYVAFIKRFNEYLCSGTIIHEAHILTVGHVVTYVNSSELVVFGGLVTGTYTSFTLFLVEHVYVHPEFKRISISDLHLNEYWENDIALLKLKQKISWAPNIGSVQLMDRDFHWRSCTLFACQIVSWHHTIQYCGHSVAPMWHFIDVLWDRNCNQWNMHLLKNEEYFIDPVRTAVISWQDLGSPIICGNVMVGLTVRTNDPETAGSPSIFLSTFPYTDFITEILYGGQVDARLKEFPYVVSIWVHGNHQCGGIILDARHILTAGHCFHKRTRFQIQITFGYTTVRQFDPIIPWLWIDDIKYVPAYHTIHDESDQRKRHDIAVLTLSEPILWGPTIGHIDLPESVSFSFEQHCEVLHWEHAENEIGEFSIELKKSHVILSDQIICQLLGVKLRQNEFCARSPYSFPIADPKDSGNPIICGGKLMGIVVQAYAAPLPTIFLKIQPYREFISETMSTT